MAIYTIVAYMFLKGLLLCWKKILAMALDEGESIMLILVHFMIFMAVAPWFRHRILPFDLQELSASIVAILFLVIAAWMQRVDGRFWWIEPCQYVYYDIGEDYVWYIIHGMLDLKYHEKFSMSFMVFEQLILKMTLFLKPIVNYVVYAPISLWKQVKLVLF